MMPTIKQMQHFCAIFESGTVQGAAESVHISQPALTRSISNLESELGLPLFERSKSGMLPTEFAETIASRFKQVLLELDDIRREALLYQKLEAGHLSIGLGQAIRELVLRHCLPQFVEHYPGVSVIIREGTEPELTKALQQREVDLIIAGAASYAEHDFARSEPVMDIPVQVIVREGHPLTERKRTTVKQLSKYPQAAPTALGKQHPFWKQVDTGRNSPALPQFLCSDYTALESIVKRTDAWTVTLQTQLHHETPSSLCLLKVSDFDITIELSVIELKQRSRSPAATQFISTVRSVLLGEHAER